MRRTLALVLVAVGSVGFGMGAEAHALVRSANPADGAILETAPPAVTITFTERPDPRLSSVHVLDSTGRQVDTTPTQTTADPLTLSLPLPPLTDGVYTVSWRTVSAVDGHVAAGAFSFGVGVPAVPVNPSGRGASPGTPPPSPLGVAGRWLLYAGFAIAMGGAWVSLLAFRQSSTSLLALATTGAVLALTGFALISEAGREGAGVGWVTYLGTSLGPVIAMEAIPIIGVVLAASAAWGLQGQRRMVALAAIAILTIVAVFTHVLASHARSSTLPMLMVSAQWAHLTSFAVWIGGLAALLLGIRGLTTPLKVAAIRRFSLVAGFMLGLLALSGLLRAIDEIGSWTKLTSTGFGQLVLVKVGLFAVLALLGAINRYRNVRRGATGIGFLRQVSTGELTVAGVVLVVASLVTSLAPPSFVVASSRTTPQISAQGSDFGTTVRATLTVTPGFPGANAFALRITDYDTGKPVVADAVTLRFDSRDRPDIGESTLALTRQPDGLYEAQATNLSLLGAWNVTAVIERGLNSVEVPLALATSAPSEQITVSRAAGQPTIYTIKLPAGRAVQVYVDPGRPGFNQIHATFFDASGNELPIKDGFALTGIRQGEPAVRYPVIRLSTGHFVGQGQLAAGYWRFEFSSTTASGESMEAYVDQTIQ